MQDAGLKLAQQELRAQFAALQQLMVDRTAEILATIARHDAKCVQADERAALRNRSVNNSGQPELLEP